MKTPQIIGIITPEALADQSLQEELMLCDRLEIRYDLFLKDSPIKNVNSQFLIELTRNIESIFIGKTYIATIRLTHDGGSFPIEYESMRAAMFKDLLKECRSIYWVDIELEHPQTALLIQDLCVLEDIEMIRSHHNFKSSYSFPELKNLIDQFKSQKSKSIKLALTPQNTQEEEAIYSLIQEEADVLIAAFGMGALGKRSRVLAPLLGAPFTYAYVGEKPSAPGQWRARSLRQVLDNAPRPHKNLRSLELEPLKEWYLLQVENSEVL
jgi:3-dehydroquinate dehydratase I